MANFVYLTAVFIILLALGMFWHKLLRLTPEEGVALGIMSVMLVIFFVGLLGSTRPAVYLLYAMAAAGILLYALDFPKSREIAKPRRSFFTPGILLFAAAFVYAMAAFRNGKILHIDEIKQWVPSVQYMFAHNTLPYGPDLIGQASTFAITAPFHYFFVQLTGFVEGNLFVSNFLLTAGAVILPLSGNTWKDWKRSLCYGGIVFLSFSFLYTEPYWSMMVDQAVALWAGALIAWGLFHRIEGGRWALLAACLLTIGMMKSLVGALFALIALLGLAIRWLFSGEEGWKAQLKSLGQKIKKPKNWLVILLVAAPFLLSFIWGRYISSGTAAGGGVAVARAASSMRSSLKSMLRYLFEPVQGMHYTGFHLNVSYVTFMAAGGILFWAVWRSLKKGALRREYGALAVVYELGYIAYFGIIFYAYSTIFAAYEGETAASVVRYFSMYMMLGWLPMLIPLFHGGAERQVRESSRAGNRIIAVVLCLSLVLGLQGDFSARAIVGYQKSDEIYKLREDLEIKEPKVRELVGDEGNIYMIHQQSYFRTTGYARYLFGKRLLAAAPMAFSPDEINRIREPLSVNQDHNINYSVYEVPKALEQLEAEYLWVYSTDEFVTRSFRQMFGVTIEDGEIYRIHQENGNITLELLGSTNETSSEEEEGEELV